MVYGGNKSNYDWFKGQNNGDKKMDRKKAAKTTWKFTKIFIYFSLFFFSMWGCVQTFIVQTSPYVGQGVEITNSRDGISPSVLSMHADSVTKDGETIYRIGTPKTPDNVYLSVKDEDQAAILDAVEEELDWQAGDHNNYSLADANHGGNIVPRLVFNGKDYGYLQLNSTTHNFEFNTKLVGTPVVASTDAIAQDATYAQYVHPVNLQFLNPDSATGDAFATPLEIDWSTWVANPNEPAAWHSFNMAIVQGLVEFAKAEMPTLAIDGNHVVDDASKDGIKMSDYIIAHNNAILAISNWAGYRVNLAYHPAVAEVVDKTTGAITTPAVDAYYSLEYAGDKVNGQPTRWNHNYILGFGNGYHDSSYVPISTWGEAFDMSKGGGPFYGIFVYPIAWLTNALVDAMPFMQGWESFLSITIVILIMQLAAFLLSFKSTLEQAKMTEMNAKKAVIEAKYAAYKGNKQMENRKKQEIAEMYKKEGISQLGPMAGMLITMPIFLAMWRVVGSIQHFKGTEWLGINFAAQSMGEMFKGEWQYIPLIALTIGTQIFSQMYPRMLTKRRDKNRINVHQKAAMKKSNKTQNIMMIVFGVMSVMFNAGLQLYMIIRSLWKIAEVQITHHILIYKKRKAREQGGSSSTGDKFSGFKKMFKKKEKTEDSSKENVKTFKKPKWMTRPKKEEVPVAKISVS